KKEYEKNLRKLRKRLEDSENEIERLEDEIRAIDMTFMEPDNYSEADQQNFSRYQELRERLNEEMERWTEYSEQVEEYIQNGS
ncbi:MAG TPA: ABC transporter C-terminal domain-containing protein, partial [Bacteroidales bacterium]|nr:ABC transporter C-terminal domain-containing protein [Bacteroidales bacterium]